MEKITNARIKEEYLRIKHKSGATILLYPMKGYSTAYALFATKYGSVDTTFKTNEDPDFVTVPEGIAHYLEHKLFENDECDAFDLYAKTGANANAYTSFDKTAYLFSCSQKFEENLRILLGFVQEPYFTDATVAKEQGIIGQEIRMYEDDTGWRVFFNCLQAMYEKNPVRIDIAGTIESIAKIDKDLLYRCYNTFYNLNNMALCVCGNCTEEEVLALCDKMLKKSEPVEVERVFEEEPDTIVQPLVEEKLPVACPMFQFGVKEAVTDAHRTEKDLAVTEVLLDIMASDSSPMFRKLLDAGLVNEASFSYEYFEGTGYGALLFGGESGNPEAVCDAIREEMARLKREGVKEEDVRRSAKSLYGANVSGLNSPDVIANAVMTMHFNDRELFRYIECFSEITAEDVNARIQTLFDMDKTAASIIRPLDEA